MDSDFEWRAQVCKNHFYDVCFTEETKSYRFETRVFISNLSIYNKRKYYQGIQQMFATNQISANILYDFQKM